MFLKLTNRIKIDDCFYLNVILYYLTFIGYNPLKKTAFTFLVIKLITLVTSTFFVGLVIVYFYVNFSTITVDEISQLGETFGTTINILSKAFILTRFESELKELLTAHYWKFEGVDEKLKAIDKGNFNFIKYCGIAFVVGTATCVVIYFYYSVSSNQLMFFCYVPNKYYLTTEAINLIEFIFAVLGAQLLVGFDLSFMYLCYKHVTQFQLIAYRMANITESDDPHVELNKCIEHHSFMLRLFRTVNKTYQIFFLVQYMVVMFSCATQLFQLMEGNANLDRAVKSILYLVTITVQFVGCNCYFAQQLADSVIGVREAAYNSKWYEGDRNLAGKMLVVLSITQKDMYLQASGVANINMAVLTRLFQATFSMANFLRIMQEK